MPGTIKNRSKNKSRPNWFYSIFIGKDEAGKKRFLYASGFAKKSEAEEARDAALAEWKREKAAPAAPKTLAEYFPQWLKDYAVRNCTPATVERYQHLANLFLPTLGALRLDQITPMKVELEMNRLHDSGGRRKKKRGFSPKTVRAIATVLSGALKSAVRWGLIPSNPCTVAKLPRLLTRERTALDLQQTDWLLESARGTWLHPIFVLAASTGARRGELLALTWSDVDLDAKRLTISKSLEQSGSGLRVKSTKNRKSRQFPLPDQAVEVLHQVREEQARALERFGDVYRTDLDLVLGDEIGEYRRPNSVSTAASRAMQRAGFKGVSLHNLRHSHGSQLLSEGVPLPAVSSRLGHANTHVTASVYSHAMQRDEQQAAEKWGAAMKRSRAAQAAQAKN